MLFNNKKFNLTRFHLGLCLLFLSVTTAQSQTLQEAIKYTENEQFETASLTSMICDCRMPFHFKYSRRSVTARVIILVLHPIEMSTVSEFLDIQIERMSEAPPQVLEGITSNSAKARMALLRPELTPKKTYIL